MTTLAIALLVAAAAAPAPVRPNHRLTPGVVRPLTHAEVCSTKWGKDRRHVTERMKRDVFDAYGIPWSQHSLYEVDHLVSRELAGADDVANLWPQLWEGSHNARMKDRLENLLHRKVCAGEISLARAQDAIRSDWIASYRMYLQPPVRSAK